MNLQLNCCDHHNQEAAEDTPLLQALIGIVHPKIIILSLLTQPQTVSNLHEYLSSAKHKRKCLKNVGNQTAADLH